ncbi:MAG: hypothetical protein WAM24_07265 [Ignavibacteriaceae bacterium]
MLKRNDNFLFAVTILIIYFLFFPAKKADAQVLSDTLEYITVNNSLNKLSTKFDKLLNTYILNSNVFYNNDFGKFSFKVSEDYNSTYIKSAEKSIKDEHFFSTSTAYKLKPYLNIGISALNNILSDNRRIEINQASESNVVLFSQFIPEEKIYISPYLGYANNRQVGENDYGYLYGMEGLVNKLQVSDFDISSQLKLRNEDITPRKNIDRYFNLLVLNNFDQDVLNSINLKFSQSRRDFYYNADAVTARYFDIINNIQDRIETNYFLQDNLNYNNIFDNVSVNLSGGVNLRSIDRNTRYRSAAIATSPSFDTKSIFDTRIDELKIDLESIINYRTDNFNSALRFNYSERDEKHITKNFPGIDQRFFDERSDQENQKNNNAIRASLAWIGNLFFSPTDRLSFSFFQNKLRYDTPSPVNFDDRDEILSIIRLRYSKMLTPFFEAFISAEGTLNHIVYIFSEKSSNNNINRIVKLSAGGNYNGRNFASLNNFEVSANYTVYDFEDINPTYRSFSFRQFTATDSSSIDFNEKFGLSFFGYIKLSEQGDLKWASFSTKPNRFLTEFFAEPKFKFIYAPLQLSAGLRYFGINTYNYNGMIRKIDSKYLSVGPVSEILLYLNTSLYLRIYGWYEFITTNSTVKRQQANLTMQVNYNF